MDKDTLIQLVSQAKRGDVEAIGALYERYKDVAYSIAMRETKSRVLADDIVQETFIEVIQKIGDLKEPGAFPSWLKTVAYHQCTRYYKQKETVHETDALENEDGFTVFDTLEERNASFIPDDALDQREFRDTILTLIDELPDAQRSALHMFYFEELPLKVIAEVQGVSVNTANTRLNRGRKAMKGSIEQYEKKHGIRLHTIVFFPFFKWLLSGSEETMSASSSATVAQNISAATGVEITATSAAAGATAAMVSTGATAGIGGKFAAIPFALKVISCVIATAIALSVPALLLSGNKPLDTPSDEILESTEVTEVIEDGSQQAADDADYILIDLFQAIDYICYVEKNQSFIIRQADDFCQDYSNGWCVHNVDKLDDCSLFVIRGDDSEGEDYCYYSVDADSFDGTTVTVKVILTRDRIDEYEKLGVKPKNMEKEFTVVSGEYVEDVSGLSGISVQDLNRDTVQHRVFFWSDPQNQNTETQNLLELVVEHAWSSATNTETCSIYGYSNLIKTDRDEMITQKNGTTLNHSMLFGNDELFVSADSYIEIYRTRWNYGVELLDDAQKPFKEIADDQDRIDNGENLIGAFTSAEQRTLNVFLSNFAEAGLGTYPADDYDLLHFAYTHCRINKPGVIEYVGNDQSCFSSDDVDTVLDCFFGHKILHRSMQNSYGYQFEYRDGFYYLIEAYGESGGLFSVAHEMYQNADGTYTVFFANYYNPREENPTRYYGLSPMDIADYSELKKTGTGKAILRANKKTDGSISYQLIKLDFIVQ